MAGFPASIIAGNITVMAKDAYGNTIPDYGARVHFSSSDPQADLPADTPLINGTRTFTATLKTTGSRSLTASDSQNSATRAR